MSLLPPQDDSAVEALLVNHDKHATETNQLLETLIHQGEKNNPEHILEAHLLTLDRIAKKLEEPQPETPAPTPETVADTVTIKGLRGEKGEKGDKGDTGETIVGPQGEIGPMGPPGTDGYAPVRNVDYFDGKPGKDGRDGTDADEQTVVAAVLAKIPKPKNGKDGTNANITGEEIVSRLKSLEKPQRLSYDDLKDLPNLAAIQRLASKSIEIYDESAKIEGNLESLNFTGSGVTTTSDGHGNITVVITGGANPTIYSETPSGLINGANATYTLLHNVSTVYTLAINGQFIHPTDYSKSTNTITFTTPLDSSLSGTPFTIVYN